ncbi:MULTISPECIES: PQQ-dependent sugar dehydrogenase [unclassified Nostoc]|uniref:PQQ-dependent sugar dehydrogenase n=1 Tax=unclassified Nostoc TaxID=2593658 RepID=UPI001F54DF96|nr:MULTISPECIES: PQQ-dependent sugar dehydrogenase [unclassified Nostoc]
MKQKLEFYVIEVHHSHHDVILEWKTTNPAANTFSGTVREIMRIEQPYPDHNVGQLGFNPNVKPGNFDYGMLYIATADGGSDGFPVSDTDPLDNGQDLSTLLGKILRINPLGGAKKLECSFIVYRFPN